MASHHLPPPVVRAAALFVLSGLAAPVAGGAPAQFHTVVPCRVFDSRLPADAPALSSGLVRTIDIAGVCTVPPEATAVALNLAVTQPDATGHLILFAAGAPTPPVSTINFSAGQTRANNAIVQLSAGGQIDALAVTGPAGTVHLILDVSGYFVDDVPPTGVDDASTVTEDAAATTIDVLANDTDPDGGPISIDSVTQPGGGTVVVTNGGADLTYQPDPDYCNAPPGTAPDTFTYTLSPGSSTATVSVTVTCVNDAPVLAGAGMATFVEGGPPVAVAPGLTVTDVDDADLEAATVTIDNLMNPGAEILATDTTGTAIVASYTAPTLTLSGTDTVANYQLVLRRVTFANTSGAPDPTPRGVTFVANDGDLDSSPATATVDVVPSNTPPVLTAGGGSPAFTEDGPAVAVDPALAAADVDDVNLESATVTITNLADTGSEVLAASTAGTAIVAGYTAPTLTLTGTDTVANYQQVLRSVTYANTSQSPSTAARSIAFVANDGATNGNTATTTLTVTAVNDAPVLTAGGGSPTFTEDGPVVVVDPALAVADVDDTSLESATVTITNIQDFGPKGLPGAEVLAASTAGTSIVASYVAPTLTLSGTDTVANYRQVLRSVTYLNTSQNPSTTARAIAFVANDGTSNSNTATTTVSVVAVNDPPVVAGAGTVTFTEDAGAVAVAPALGVTDLDDTNLESATVTITNLQDVGLEALAANTGGTVIAAAYVAPTLTLTGTDTVANYQAVLQSVSYNNASQAPSLTDRAVAYTVNDGSVNSNTALSTVQVVPVNDPPILTTNPITYATAGNTQLHVAGDTLAGVASIADAQGALAKSVPTDLDGPLAPAVVAASGASVNGGSFTIDTDGSFTYVPPAGFAGTDSFTYQVTDSVTPVIGTVNVTVSSVVWYVRDVVDANNQAGGDGRSTNAFETLAAAESASGAGHFIFVFAGNTAVTSLAGPIALKDGQKLYGEGVGLSVPSFPNIVAAGAQPRIDNGAGDAVSVPATAGSRNGVEIRGLDLQGTGNAVDVTATGANTVGVTISNNTVRGAGQEGIDLNAGSTGLFTATVQSNAITATGNGLDARRTVAGQLQADFGANTVVSGGVGVLIDGSAGTATVTGFANNSVSGNTVGAGVMITTATFDSTPGGVVNQVAGGVTAIGASGNGVGGAGLVLTNVSGDLAFTDLDVFADGGTALFLTGTGAFNGTTGTQLTVPAGVGTLSANGGAAADATNATIDLRLGALTSANSPGSGVRLVNVSDGTVPALFSAPSASSITNAAGIDLSVSGGNAGITYAGPINNTANRAVSITSWSGDDPTDDLVLSGAITESGTGILVMSNAGSRAITFSGGLTLNPAPGNVGLSASGNTNAGGLQVTGGPNTIATTSAAALSVTNTSIGSAGLTFRSLSATGGTNGIVLTNTGTLGGLTVTGTGGAGTGGVIQNMTGDGITLTNTRSVSLSNMSITNNQGSGILGDDVTDFSLIGSSVTNNGNTADGTEAGLRFNELLGTCAITNTTISGSSEDNVRITPDSGVLTNLTVSGSTIGPNSPTTGGNGITLLGTGTASATLTVTNSTFANNRGTAILSNFASTGSHTVNVSGSIFRDNGKGVSLASNTSTDLTFGVLNNPEIVRSGSNALELITSFDATSAMQAQGTFSGNAVGDGAPDSGSADLHGIAVDLRGDERSILAVTNNTVRDVDLVGLFIQDADFGVLAGPPSDHDLTVRDNSVQNIDDNSGFPCGAPYGTLVDMRHTTVACLDMAGNTSAESPFACGAAHFRLRQRDTSTFLLERLSDGDGTPGELINTVATVETHVVTQNDPGSTANVTLISGFTEAANGTCVKP